MSITKVLISGKSFVINQKAKNLMEYFNQAEAIQRINADEEVEINTITEQTWKQVLEVFQIVNYEFPQIAKVRTSNNEQVIGVHLAAYFNTKSPEQLNKIYQTAQFLIISGLKKVIAAYLACRIYIQPTLSDYYKKKEELSIKRELTAEIARKMKETYTFMNC